MPKTVKNFMLSVVLTRDGSHLTYPLIQFDSRMLMVFMERNRKQETFLFPHYSVRTYIFICFLFDLSRVLSTYILSDFLQLYLPLVDEHRKV